MSIDEAFDGAVKAISRIRRGPKFASAYDAGQDCARNGVNTDNCHFGWFMSSVSTAEWERGKRDAESSPRSASG